jgi:lipooligosaccharide transport system permease protein
LNLDIDLRLAFAVWMRNFTLYRHTWVRTILPNFFEPLLYLVGMGIGLGAYLQQGLDGRVYVAFIAPGLLAASAMSGASFEATYNVFIKMNFARLYDAYLGTPAQMQDIVFGELLWAVTRAMLYGLAFLSVLAGLTVFGYPILTSPAALLLPLAIAIIGAQFALVGFLFTSFIKSIDFYSYYFSLWISPLFLFSGIFFPVDRFPAGATIAALTPLFHAVRLSRGLAQGPLGTEHAVSAGYMIAVVMVLLVIVLRRFRRRMVV